MNIHDIMELLVKEQGSDIHIIKGTQPTVRIQGVLQPLPKTPLLTEEQVEALIVPLMTKEQIEYVKLHKEHDFGYQFKEKGRFRVNVYHAKGCMAAAMRLIPNEIRTLAQLGMPETIANFAKYQKGLVLVTGPTGEGKSTTLAALIDMINTERADHIVTIEDPIEFVYEQKKSILSQRELHADTESWTVALKSVLREDPDVVLVGEMRDYDTIAATITIAETGHLVFATLHTSSAAQTVDRIIDVFPAHQQSQVRQQLAASLAAVVSQRLVPTVDGKRAAATEIMLGTPAIANLIRESKAHQIDSVIQTQSQVGMKLMENALLELHQKGVITAETAQTYAFRSQEMARLLGKNG